MTESFLVLFYKKEPRFLAHGPFHKEGSASFCKKKQKTFMPFTATTERPRLSPACSKLPKTAAKPYKAPMSLRQKQSPAPAPSVSPTVPFLDLRAQQARIGPEMRRRIDAVLAHCQFVLGPEVAELEAELARRAGATHCVSVSSGTDALLIAMMAEEIGPGDGRLPSRLHLHGDRRGCRCSSARRQCSSISTPTPSRWMWPTSKPESRPVRDAGQLRPRAVIGVDLFGQPADWPALTKVARRHTLFTVDDCAQAFGAALQGRPLGTQADCTADQLFPPRSRSAAMATGAPCSPSPPTAPPSIGASAPMARAASGMMCSGSGSTAVSIRCRPPCCSPS